MLVISDMSSVYNLFLMGLAAGAFIGAIPWVIGYAINGVLSVIRNS